MIVIYGSVRFWNIWFKRGIIFVAYQCSGREYAETSRIEVFIRFKHEADDLGLFSSQAIHDIHFRANHSEQFKARGWKKRMLENLKETERLHLERELLQMYPGASMIEISDIAISVN